MITQELMKNMKDKEYKSKSLEALGCIYNFGADADDKFYHNTKLLLKLYSKVLWRMSTHCNGDG